MLTGCTLFNREHHGLRIPKQVPTYTLTLEATGYCRCRECCGWTRNWWGRPSFASGPLKGKRKIVGQTASGSMAKAGTLAADTSLFPFGTIMYIPGYGYGRVEDVGSDIKGKHIDLYFTTHHRARQWGRQQKTVKVWVVR